MTTENMQRTVLVTGATGQQGGAVARQLLANGFTVRAFTRKPESPAARELARLGAEIVAGDLDDVAAVERALAGAWGAFAVQTMMEAGVAGEQAQGRRFAELAHKAGIRHFVYSSVASADKQTGIPHFDSKWQIEETVRKLGFPSYTILRPVFFMDNFTSPWMWPAVEHGKLVVAIQPQTRLQMIAVDDIGRFGLLAFARHAELNGVAIDIAGDEKTMPKAAQILGQALAKQIEFVSLPVAEVRKMSEDMAIMYEWFDRVGYSIDIPALASRYGFQPLSLQAWSAKVKWPQPAQV